MSNGSVMTLKPGQVLSTDSHSRKGFHCFDREQADSHRKCDRAFGISSFILKLTVNRHCILLWFLSLFRLVCVMLAFIHSYVSVFEFYNIFFI